MCSLTIARFLYFYKLLCFSVSTAILDWVLLYPRSNLATNWVRCVPGYTDHTQGAQRGLSGRHNSWFFTRRKWAYTAMHSAMVIFLRRHWSNCGEHRHCKGPTLKLWGRCAATHSEGNMFPNYQNGDDMPHPDDKVSIQLLWYKTFSITLNRSITC